jgi:hypothetical protein
MRNLSITFGLLASLSAPALAGGDTPAAAPPETARALHRLVGDWKVKGTFTMGGETAAVGGSIKCKKTSSQFGVLCATRFTGIPGAETYEETDLFGYDPGDGLVHWFSVTSGGETHDHKGGIQGDTWTFQHAGPASGAIFTERITLVFDGKKTVKGKTAMWLGDESLGTFQFTLSK